MVVLRFSRQPPVWHFRSRKHLDRSFRDHASSGIREARAGRPCALANSLTVTRNRSRSPRLRSQVFGQRARGAPESALRELFGEDANGSSRTSFETRLEPIRRNCHPHIAASKADTGSSEVSDDTPDFIALEKYHKFANKRSKSGLFRRFGISPLVGFKHHEA
jgi:hypothetical protein